jgi:hypothetical protein
MNPDDGGANAHGLVHSGAPPWRLYPLLHLQALTWWMALLKAYHGALCLVQGSSCLLRLIELTFKAVLCCDLVCMRLSDCIHVLIKLPHDVPHRLQPASCLHIGMPCARAMHCQYCRNPMQRHCLATVCELHYRQGNRAKAEHKPQKEAKKQIMSLPCIPAEPPSSLTRAELRVWATSALTGLAIKVNKDYKTTVQTLQHCQELCLMICI